MSGDVRTGDIAECGECARKYALKCYHVSRIRKGFKTFCSPGCAYDFKSKRLHDPAGRKQCGGCKEWLDLSAFSQDRARPGRVRSRCRACKREARRAYVASPAGQAYFSSQQFREWHRANAAKYREAHRAEINARRRAWNKANPDRALGYAQGYRQRHPERQASIILTRAYIASKLGLPVGRLPADLYEASRLYRIIKRHIEGRAT